MILDKLFGSDDSSNGCTGHHYGKWEVTDNYRSDVRRAYRPRAFVVEGALKFGEPANFERPTTATVAVLIEQRETKTCQHDGCNATKSRWVEAARKEIDDIVGEE